MNLLKSKWESAAVFSVLLLGLIQAGCSQREDLPTEVNAVTDQHLPFESTSDKGGIFPTDSLAPMAIPAGTPVTVHLLSALSSATSRSGDFFEAILDEPLILRGRIAVPPGATVTGKILEAGPSGQLHDPGYIRLALAAISVNGRSLPIHSSSIFVTRGSHEKQSLAVIASASGNNKGALIDTSAGTAVITGNRDVGVAEERRLTFHLSQSLPFQF